MNDKDISPLFRHDLKYMDERKYPLVGVDEAGRGPLAGPVVAAAVILPLDERIDYSLINDSKQLKPEIRQEVALKIKEVALDWAVGIVSPREIDRLNIFQATMLAMFKALKDIKVEYRFVLIDGNKTHPDLPASGQQCLVKGDAKSLHIAAASILAKVTRDELVSKYDHSFPGYGFSEHKGYATAKHFKALKNLGPTPVHRFSFSPVWESFLVHYSKKADLSHFVTCQLSLLGPKKNKTLSDKNTGILKAREIVQSKWKEKQKTTGINK